MSARFQGAKHYLLRDDMVLAVAVAPGGFWVFVAEASSGRISFLAFTSSACA
jgi:hypothetical protein